MRPIEMAVLTRRGLLRVLLGVPAALLVAACGGQATGPPSPTAPATGRTAGAVPTPVPATATTAPPAVTTPAAARDITVPTTQAQPALTPAPTTPQPGQAQVLAPTPECGDADDVTPRQAEGPFYTPRTPERASLLDPGMTGTKLTVTGKVLTTGCQPIARALLDFWQADDQGQYDNVGFRLRGHQFADGQGRYRLETVVPGLYPGRTRHIHVKVQAPNQPVLTTQLYFSNEPRNTADALFNPRLVMDVQDAPAGGKLATFDFVLDVPTS